MGRKAHFAQETEMPIIECTIKRPRVVTLGDTAYQFQPDEQGRYVAEVEDEDHADRLLEIRCYRKLATTPKQVKQQKQEEKKNEQPTGSVDTRPEGAAVETPNAANSGNPLTGHGLGTIQPDDNGEGVEGGNREGEGNTETLDRAKLAAEYEAKFKKKPHHSQSAERIKQLLEQEED
jgi:hypothetical protein